MKVTFMLADYAVAVEGKLYISGGGWTFNGPDPGPGALALILEVPWHQTNRQLPVRIQLVDEDGNATLLGPERQPVIIDAELEVGRPPGHPAGVAFNVPMAINYGALPLEPGRRYAWTVTVDGETRDEWRCGFGVRPRGLA